MKCCQIGCSDSQQSKNYIPRDRTWSNPYYRLKGLLLATMVTCLSSLHFCSGSKKGSVCYICYKKWKNGYDDGCGEELFNIALTTIVDKLTYAAIFFFIYFLDYVKA